MNKVILVFVFFIAFNYKPLCAQQSLERNGKGTSTDGINLNNVLVINWKSSVSILVLNQIVLALSTKYKPKIIVASLTSTSDKLNVIFNPLIIAKEDILQIIKSEGILDPYFIEKQNRYYLDNYGFITSDPVKL